MVAHPASELLGEFCNRSDSPSVSARIGASERSAVPATVEKPGDRSLAVSCEK